MQLIKYIIIFIILLFIEKNLLQLISINEITPDLILIFVVIISLREKRITSTFIGFVSGLIQDVFTTSFFGLSALTKLIIGFWGNFFQQPKKKYNLLFYMTTFFVLVFAHELIYQIVFRLGSNIKFFRLFFYHAVPRMLYTLFLAAIVYLIFNPVLWKSERTSDRS